MPLGLVKKPGEKGLKLRLALFFFEMSNVYMEKNLLSTGVIT